MNTYFETTIAKYKLPDDIDDQLKSIVVDPITSDIADWTSINNFPLNEVKISGSRAKGTAISLASDLDLFISLSSSTDATLETIYNSLYEYLLRKRYKCRKQNVSIGLTYQDRKIDLVPGKRQSQWSSDHSLYKNKQQTWTKTNIDTHIDTVRSSGRTIEIVAAKIWRERHSLEFPSLLLELTSIEALKHHGSNSANNFFVLLRYLKENMAKLRIIDPANTNNILSDDLTYNERIAIALQASLSLEKASLREIIW